MPSSKNLGRLLVPSGWLRTTAGATEASATGRSRSPAEYSPAALPERQAALATLLPTTLGGLALCATGILLAEGMVLAIGFHAPALASLERLAGPRFANTAAAVKACIDPEAALPLARWMAQVLLFAAASVALVVRSMRRQRRGDRLGRSDGWGGLACLLGLASLTAQVPAGRLVGILLTDATGFALGPAGFGWWVAIAATLLCGVSLRAVLPLYERLATALWLSAGLGGWAASAAAVWPGLDGRINPGVAAAAWAVGSGCLMIAMLAAARSVIREARGESVRAAPPKPRPAVVRPATGHADVAESADHDHATGWGSDASTATDYTDGSDVEEGRETRHLSKAERKRLRKLARMNRAA